MSVSGWCWDYDLPLSTTSNVNDINNVSDDDDDNDHNNDKMMMILSKTVQYRRRLWCAPLRLMALTEWSPQGWSLHCCSAKENDLRPGRKGLMA